MKVPRLLSTFLELRGFLCLSLLVQQTLEKGCGSSIERSKKQADPGKAFILLYWKMREGIIHKKMQESNYFLQSKFHTLLTRYIFLRKQAVWIQMKSIFHLFTCIQKWYHIASILSCLSLKCSACLSAYGLPLTSASFLWLQLKAYKAYKMEAITVFLGQKIQKYLLLR